MKRFFSLLLVPVVAVALSLSAPAAFGQEKKEEAKKEHKKEKKDKKAKEHKEEKK